MTIKRHAKLVGIAITAGILLIFAGLSPGSGDRENVLTKSDKLPINENVAEPTIVPGRS